MMVFSARDANGGAVAADIEDPGDAPQLASDCAIFPHQYCGELGPSRRRSARTDGTGDRRIGDLWGVAAKMLQPVLKSQGDTLNMSKILGSKTVRRDATRYARREWVRGQVQALWPELDFLAEQFRHGKRTCA